MRPAAGSVLAVGQAPLLEKLQLFADPLALERAYLGVVEVAGRVRRAAVVVGRPDQVEQVLIGDVGQDEAGDAALAEVLGTEREAPQDQIELDRVGAVGPQ